MTRHATILTSHFLLSLALFSTTPGCTNAYRQEQQLKRAERYFSHKRYQEASSEYVNVLRKDPTNLTALCQLGLCFLELHDLERASMLLLKAEKLAPTDPEVMAVLARLYLATGTPGKARERALSAFKQETHPLEMLALLAEAARTRTEAEAALRLAMDLPGPLTTNADYHTTSGLLHLKLGDFNSAETCFRQALTQQADFPRAHLGLAMLHQAQGHATQAEQAYRLAAGLAGFQSAENIKLALFLRDTGRPDEARLIFEHMAGQAPQNLLPRLQLARIAFSRRRFEDAEKHAQSILALHPDHAEARLLRAKSKLAGNQADQGLAELQHLAKTFPDAWGLRYELAIALLKTTAPDKAMTELRTTLQLKPDFPEAALLLADLLIRTGDATAAIPLLNDLAASHPGLTSPYLLLGAAHQALGQLDQALGAYARLERLNPASPQPHYLAGLVRIKQGNREAAAAAFSKSSQLAPAFMLPLAQLATLDLHEQKGDQALTRIDRAIRQAPNSGSLHYLRGQVLLWTGQPDKAEYAFLRAIELDPDSLSAYVALSRLYMTSRRKEEALKRLASALAQDPHDHTCLMLTALLQTQQGENQQAAANYEGVIKTKPDFAPALNNLACLYAGPLNQLDKAFKLATRARELAPHDPAVADTLGWIAFLKGDVLWALSLLQESANALPADTEVSYHLARAQLSAGRETDAREALTLALKTPREFPGKELAERLAILLDGSQSPVLEIQAQRIRDVLEKDPGNPAAWLRQGRLLEAKGEMQPAMRIYEKLRKESPSYYPATIRLATLLSKERHSLDRAYALAQAVRQSAPSDPEAAHLLGWLAYLKMQYPWAMSLLTEASRTENPEPGLLYHLALAKYRMGREAESATLMHKALAARLPPEERDEALEFLELTDPGIPDTTPGAALAMAATRLREDPGHLPALMLASRANLALGKTAEARRLYEQILQLHTDFPPALLALATLYAESPGGLDKALEAAQKARTLMPDSLPATALLGRLALEKGQTEYAAALLQEAVNKHTAIDPDTLLALGLARLRLKESGAARKLFQQVINSAPTSSAAESARARLNETEP